MTSSDPYSATGIPRGFDAYPPPRYTSAPVDFSLFQFDPTQPPRIESLDDIVSIQEMGAILHMKPATLRKYMRGYEGKPPLPYVRIARVPHFSKRQVAWWLDQVQNMPDALMVDVRRATKGK